MVLSTIDIPFSENKIACSGFMATLMGGADVVNAVSSGRVLVVDGDRGSRETVARLLRATGYEVAVAATSAEALVLAEEANFALAVIEYAMPYAGRVDLFQRLRWRCPKIRGIFLTESSSAYGTASALAVGVERVVQRSAAMSQSGSWLRELVGGHD